MEDKLGVKPVPCPTTEGRFPGRWIQSDSLAITKGEHLPRWSVDRAVYHVSFHLADSVPVVERLKWLEIRREHGKDRDLLKAAYDNHVERYLTAGNGSCWLQRPDVAHAVAEVLEHSNGRTYGLHAWCIMPNHIHMIVSFDQGADVRSTIVLWKRIMAHRINKLTNRAGAVWMDDAYSRIIRTVEEYRRQVSYVWNNPESAGLTEGFLRKKYV